jgi:hypothetical protein
VNVNAEDFVAPRYHKKIKNKLVWLILFIRYKICLNDDVVS